jgi:hypothetical protein
MPLNPSQIHTLDAAIAAYAFPLVYFDFSTGTPLTAPSVAVLEAEIKRLLISLSPTDVKNGLANVIYWGNANAGYRDYRVGKFRTGVTTAQLTSFQGMVAGGRVPTLGDIRGLRMPGYSGISFISKILMFLDPRHYPVLDLQLASLAIPHGGRAIDRLVVRTQMPISAHNIAAHDAWRMECLYISNIYFGGRYRAVDIERGLFHLVQSGRSSDASNIYHSA